MHVPDADIRSCKDKGNSRNTCLGLPLALTRIVEPLPIFSAISFPRLGDSQNARRGTLKNLDKTI
jgi:hypothetical protein